MIAGLSGGVPQEVPPATPGEKQEPAVSSIEVRDQEEKHRKDIEADIRLGREYSVEIDKELKPSDDQVAIERVRKIGNELAAIAIKDQVNVSWGDPRLNPFPYEFRVVQGKDVNAFSLPGGIIYVYEGLLKYVESDDELAGVLAHEISHAAFRHIATLRREQSKLDIFTIPLILLGLFKGGDTGTGALMAGTLLNQAMGSGWSVRAERAADYGGLQYMLKSRYNPVGSLTFMERLAYDDRKGPQYEMGIYRTHPPSRERAETLIDELKSAGIPIQRSKVTTSFKSTVKPGDNGTVQLWFGQILIHEFGGSDALTRADGAVGRLDALMDEVPKLFEVELRSGNRIIGKNQELFVVVQEDADAQKGTLRSAEQRALEGIKRAIYDLSYRIWDFR